MHTIAMKHKMWSRRIDRARTLCRSGGVALRAEPNRVPHRARRRRDRWRTRSSASDTHAIHTAHVVADDLADQRTSVTSIAAATSRFIGRAAVVVTRR